MAVDISHPAMWAPCGHAARFENGSAAAHTEPGQTARPVHTLVAAHPSACQSRELGRAGVAMAGATARRWVAPYAGPADAPTCLEHFTGARPVAPVSATYLVIATSAANAAVLGRLTMPFNDGPVGARLTSADLLGTRAAGLRATTGCFTRCFMGQPNAFVNQPTGGPGAERGFGKLTPGARGAWRTRWRVDRRAGGHREQRHEAERGTAESHGRWTWRRRLSIPEGLLRAHWSGGVRPRTMVCGGGCPLPGLGRCRRSSRSSRPDRRSGHRWRRRRSRPIAAGVGVQVRRSAYPSASRAV